MLIFYLREKSISDYIAQLYSANKHQMLIKQQKGLYVNSTGQSQLWLPGTIPSAPQDFFHFQFRLKEQLLFGTIFSWHINKSWQQSTMFLKPLAKSETRPFLPQFH